MNDIDRENLFRELVAFIRKQVGEYEMPISRETLLEEDLGVTGDDAYDLLMAIGSKYHFDLKNFKFKEYFNDEPAMFDTSRHIKRFIVGYLEKAIIQGRLDEDVINS